MIRVGDIINVIKIFKSLRATSQAVYGDKNRLAVLLRDAIKKSENVDDFVAIKNELRIVFKLTKDFISGRYRGVNKKSMFMIIAALIYLVNPMDIVPDALLGIGFLDDLSVFTYMLGKIAKELEKYKEWNRDEEI